MIRKSIKKIDIIKNLSLQTGFSYNFSKKIINDLIEVIILNIGLGSLILKNIGSFKLIKKKQNECWENILRELSKNGIKVCETKQLNLTEKKWLKTYFVKEIFPLLTPVAIDPAHPFPFVPNLGLSIVLKLKSKKSKNIIRVVIPFPKGLKKFIKIDDINKYIATEKIIISFIDILFPKFTFI